ncbi:MAG: slipin family protein, partial [Candidatus Micrarchaeota archaeon]
VVRMLLEAIIVIVLVLVLASIKIIDQWERGVILTLGKYSYTIGPGVNFVIPVLQRVMKVDLRIKTIDVPKQEVMTKDNVPVHVNAVVYFKVSRPEDAIIKIEDYAYAVSQYAQTALRDVIGNTNLDEVLTEREKIAVHTKSIVDKETEEWGVDITAIKMQDIELPADMKRAMARQAEAEREKRATIIMSEGEVTASGNLSKAAATLSKAHGAMHLRTLQTISDVSSDKSTIIFVTPIEVLEAFRKFGGK